MMYKHQIYVHHVSVYTPYVRVLTWCMHFNLHPVVAQDILRCGLEAAEGDYKNTVIVYTNADIAIQENFYNNVDRISKFSAGENISYRCKLLTQTFTFVAFLCFFCFSRCVSFPFHPTILFLLTSIFIYVPWLTSTCFSHLVVFLTCSALTSSHAPFCTHLALSA